MTEHRTSHGFLHRDPFEVWRQFYEANEQVWSKTFKELYDSNEQAWTSTLKDMTTTQWFAEAQGKMLESFLALQKVMRETMTAQLTSLNLPSRDDVARLGELIVGLEEKVDQLEDRLANVEEHLTRQTRASEASIQPRGSGERAKAPASRAPVASPSPKRETAEEGRAEKTK